MTTFLHLRIFANLLDIGTAVQLIILSLVLSMFIITRLESVVNEYSLLNIISFVSSGNESYLIQGRRSRGGKGTIAPLTLRLVGLCPPNFVRKRRTCIIMRTREHSIAERSGIIRSVWDHAAWLNSRLMRAHCRSV